MDLKKFYACSFTGHRHIEEGHKAELPGLVLRAIEYAYGLGCRTFYCGGAVGFDSLAAREVVRFRMSHSDARLVLLLPCINQNERWSPSQKDIYDYILSSADEVRYSGDEYTPSCMKERNLALAESADIVVAYVGRGRSGSAQTARMAEKLGKKVYNLYPSVAAEKINKN